MIKFNSYSTELKRGDIVIFNDDSRKVVEKAIGHKIWFVGNEFVDLWVIEDQIKGVILRNRSTIETSKVEKDEVVHVKMGLNRNTHVPLCNTYKELYLVMNKPRNFYHFSEYNNVIKMIRTGYIYSRKKAERYLIYDNKERNESSYYMLSSNESWQLKNYARFYLNPKNEVTFSFKFNLRANNTFGVILALPFSAIWKSNTQVILTPKNATNLSGNWFDWSKYNIGSFEPNLKNYSLNDFDYNESIKTYDADKPNKYLTAEILFYDAVPIDLVEYFVFANEYQRQLFLSKLDKNQQSKYNVKCIVNKELFW